ncbi:MAG: CopG family antitoxin [Prolixibacteraceae bacterium]|nr:CopG family antitoxin [Prolixibacteraceae bacterium]
MKEIFNKCNGFEWHQGNYLKPSSKTISLRLPEHILNDIKMLALERDVPYKSLIKIFLSDRLNEELKHYGRE